MLSVARSAARRVRPSREVVIAWRARVDETFVEGALERVTQVARSDIEHRLANHEPLDAGFSAAHYLVLTGDRCWSDDDHDRILGAWRDAAVAEERAGRWTQSVNQFGAGHTCASSRTTTAPPMRR